MDPTPLVKKLYQLPQGAEFQDGGQHDCQEALRSILMGLHDDLVRRPPSFSVDMIHELKTQRSDQTIINLTGCFLTEALSPVVSCLLGRARCLNSLLAHAHAEPRGKARTAAE